MSFPFEKCKNALFQGAFAALQESASSILSLKPTAQGDVPVNGLSYDISPWHGALGLSIRVSYPEGEYDEDVASWKHFDFISDRDSLRLRETGQLIQELYVSAGAEHYREMAHLVFLAGAEALLDRQIGEQLRKLGVNAPIVTDEFQTTVFTHRFYMVFDPDESIRANYCEIVLANRITARLLRES
jgi:hypothetical protein